MASPSLPPVASRPPPKDRLSRDAPWACGRHCLSTARVPARRRGALVSAIGASRSQLGRSLFSPGLLPINGEHSCRPLAADASFVGDEGLALDNPRPAASRTIGFAQEEAPRPSARTCSPSFSLPSISKRASPRPTYRTSARTRRKSLASGWLLHRLQDPRSFGPPPLSAILDRLPERASTAAQPSIHRAR